MGSDTMWLDRLPRKTDVISQYLYMKREEEANFTRCATKEMVAHTVAYIWDQAGLSRMKTKEIETAVSSLIRDVKHQILQGDPALDCQKYNDLHGLSKMREADILLSSLLQSDQILELFDVSPPNSDCKDSFYLDQKSDRKLRIQKMKCRQSLKGDDIFFRKIFKQTHTGSIGDFTEHYCWNRKRLPTRMDILKYHYSRMALRKVSVSAGPFPSYDIASSKNEVAKVVDSIWAEKFGQTYPPSASFHKISDTIKGYFSNKANEKYLLSKIHRETKESAFHLNSTDSYNPVMYRKLYDEEIFDTFFHCVRKPRIKLRTAEKMSAFKEADVEVKPLDPVSLAVPDFTAYEKFDGDAWLAHQDEVDDLPNGFSDAEDEFDALGQISSLEPDIGIQKGSFLKDSSVQTDCSLHCTHDWFH